MTFLNGALLIGLAAIGIPIVLHLIAKKEPRQVVFPSVRLLTQRFQSNRSKVRIRRWWLLALRIAAIAVVALALARPVIAGALSLTWTTIGIVAFAGIVLLAMASVAASRDKQKLLAVILLVAAVFALVASLGWAGVTLASGKTPEIDDGAPVALAVVVDNSPLSGWQDGDEDRLETLRLHARELIMSAGRNSRIALIDRSGTPAAFALDRASAIGKAEVLQPLEVVQPLESRIEAAVRLLLTSEIESRQLVVLSSLAQSSFSTDEGLAATIGESGVRVTLWDQGGFSGINRTLSVPTVSDASPPPDTPVAVNAVLSMSRSENFGGAEGNSAASDGGDVDSIRVTAECVLYPVSASLPMIRNGDVVRPEPKAIDRVNVELVSGRDLELQMTLPPLEVGLHHGAIRLVGEDALAIDNQSYFTVSVLPPSRLLLVSDEMEEAEEIAWAISAPAPVGDPRSQYAIEFISYEDLAATRLTDFDGVILLDPPANSLSETELDRYRSLGGATLVAVGAGLSEQAVQVDGWPEFQRRWRSVEPGTFLEIVAPSHPGLSGLGATPGGVPFQEFRIRQYWKVQPGPEARVLMRYAGSDHAALLELPGEEDEGRLLLLTTPIPDLISVNDAWNDLFRGAEPWPAFVLIRDLTKDLTGRSGDAWTSNVGAPVSVPLSMADAAVGQSSGEEGVTRRLQWFPPLGVTAIPVDLPDLGDDEANLKGERVFIGQPKHSGVHWIRGAAPGLGFTVNVPRDLIRGRRIDSSGLDTLFGEAQYREIDSLEEMDWTSDDAAKAVSLWSPIMLIALFVFLLEQVLANRFYRRTAAPATVPVKKGAPV